LAEQCEDIIQREPRIVHCRLADGSVKPAAGWLIAASGWKGNTVEMPACMTSRRWCWSTGAAMPTG
jgi:hypothetical protein